MIPDADTLREWDAFTIANQSITSHELMERAAQQCSNWLIKHQYHKKRILVICGKGNNGGDGLAIARQLLKHHVMVTVCVLEFGGSQSSDAKLNLELLMQMDAPVIFLKQDEELHLSGEYDVIIDAMFGFGLHSPLSGAYAQLIETINHCKVPVVSIDVPSGMFTDQSSKGNAMVAATHTLTFQALKLCFLVAENAHYTGEVHILDIGLHPNFQASKPGRFVLTDLDMLTPMYRKRKKFSHKGTFGHVLLVAGNEGKMGAAVMCAKSCLRSGVGLLTCSDLRDDFVIMHTSAPEAMMVERGCEGDLSKFSTIGIGPGLGTDTECTALVLSILQSYKQPMVLDADALNIISQQGWLNQLPAHSIITPHPKEFERLFGAADNDFEKINKAIEAAAEYNIVIVLKGAYTLVTDGKRNYFNSTGNNGLSTGGSGDVLTGLISGLLAQEYCSFDAAVCGVYVHGLAADFCLEEQSEESLLPTDIVEKFGKAFKHLQNNNGA